MSNVLRHVRWSLVTCNLAMMVLAIAVNLLPVFLTTIAVDLGRGAPLSAEQLGRIGAVTFIGLVGGILVTGPLADRWGAGIFAVGGNALIAVSLLALRWTGDYRMLLGAAFVGGAGASFFVSVGGGRCALSGVRSRIGALAIGTKISTGCREKGTGDRALWAGMAYRRHSFRVELSPRFY